MFLSDLLKGACFGYKFSGIFKLRLFNGLADIYGFYWENWLAQKPDLVPALLEGTGSILKEFGTWSYFWSVLDSEKIEFSTIVDLAH